MKTMKKNSLTLLKILSKLVLQIVLFPVVFVIGLIYFGFGGKEGSKIDKFFSNL